MNLIVLLVTFSLIIIIPKVNSAYDIGTGLGGSTDEPSIDIPTESSNELEIIDGSANLNDMSGELNIDGTEGIEKITTGSGTIPNIKSGNIIVENGNLIEGKLFFSDDSSFDLNGQSITVPKDGFIEFKDGKLIVSKNSIIEVEGTKIQAIVDETEIKMEKNLVEIEGQVSVDCENSPDKIILIGKGSSVGVQTDEDEKFEFKNSDDKELIVNIGSFHDSESEECKGKNCISYQEMGTGVSGEDWNKIKIDGNVLITKYFEEEKIYEIKFEEGKTKVYRDLSKLGDETIEFSERTVINYNKGGITLFVETSVEKAEEKGGRINAERGITDVEYYNDMNVQITDELPKVKSLEMPETTETQGVEDTTETSDTPEVIETDVTKNAKRIMIDKEGNIYVTNDGIPLNEGDKSIADKVGDILDDLNWNTVTEVDIFAALQQETSFNPRPGDGGKSVGLMQASAGAFRDVIGLWRKLGKNGNKKYQELYEEYKDYSDKQLKSALDNDALNLEVGVSYFKLMEDNYGFSEENLKDKYGYTGDEKDILLLGYNGGPGAMKQVLAYAEENIGKDEWNFNDLEKFLWDENKVWVTSEGEKVIGGASKEAEDVLGRYYDDVNTKAWIMINHVRKIKTYAGYSGYTPYKKPSWIK